MSTEEVASTSLPGLLEQRDALAAGDASARGLLEACLERIEALESRLGAFRVLRREAALAEADSADERLRAGERLPLLGVPLAIKDDVDLSGETTPFGCGGELEPARADATVVSRLRDAGAVIVGKTTSSELGQWPFTEGPAFGRTRNPYDYSRSPGGSSGGSAAAVAAGMVPAALGSDGAGSVRIPAAWCGLVGIKPSRGLAPDPEVFQFNGLGCYGPLAHNVADAAALLDVVADSGEKYSAATRDSGRPGRLRIGVSTRTPWFVPGKVHPDVSQAVDRLAGELRALGHDVLQAEPAHELAGVLFLPRSTDGVRRALARLGPRVEVEDRTREHARLGKVLGGPLLAGVMRLEPWLARRMGKVFERVDVLLAPTTAQPALRVGELDGRSYWPTGLAVEKACPFAFPWNVVGWPGVNVPAGLDSGGVPLGAQLLGRANEETKLIALAAQLEAAGALSVPPPRVA